MNVVVAAAEKTALRARLRDDRRRHVAALGDGRRATEERIAVIALDLLDGMRCVAAYLAEGGEVDPAPLIDALARRGVTTALPHSGTRESTPAFRRWSPGDELVRGPFGIRQPAAGAEAVMPDAVIVPLLGFDRAGVRLGQGAGWYDRLFAKLTDARRVGLAWSVQAVDRLPREAWDVPLHAVVTEEGVR